MIKKMKGIYFTQAKSGQKSNLGPINKIKDQISAFKSAGFDMQYVNFAPLETGLRKTFLGKGIFASLPFFSVFSPYKYDKRFNGYSFYYIRFEAADYSFRTFLKQLRKNNPLSKIIIEFPDYPNTIWMKGILFLGIYLKDLYARKFYKKYIDRFAVWNREYKSIYSVPTVYYTNGINVSRLPLRNVSCHFKNELHLLGLSSMFAFHGFDRLLRGLKTYYASEKSVKIYFHIVGDDIGGERKKYQCYVNNEKLNGYIKFYDQKIGDELSSLCNEIDIAVGSLGMYRVGLKIASSLKTREYFARGFPVVSGCPIDVLLGKDYPYCIEFENDNSEIDVAKIVNWYENLTSREDIKVISENIRKFAEQNCDIAVAMKEVIEYIQGW